MLYPIPEEMNPNWLWCYFDVALHPFHKAFQNPVILMHWARFSRLSSANPELYAQVSASYAHRPGGWQLAVSPSKEHFHNARVYWDRVHGCNGLPKPPSEFSYFEIIIPLSRTDKDAMLHNPRRVMVQIREW